MRMNEPRVRYVKVNGALFDPLMRKFRRIWTSGIRTRDLMLGSAKRCHLSQHSLYVHYLENGPAKFEVDSARKYGLASQKITKARRSWWSTINKTTDRNNNNGSAIATAYLSAQWSAAMAPRRFFDLLYNLYGTELNVTAALYLVGIFPGWRVRNWTLVPVTPGCMIQGLGVIARSFTISWIFQKLERSTAPFYPFLITVMSGWWLVVPPQLRGSEVGSEGNVVLQRRLSKVTDPQGLNWVYHTDWSVPLVTF